MTDTRPSPDIVQEGATELVRRTLLAEKAAQDTIDGLEQAVFEARKTRAKARTATRQLHKRWTIEGCKLPPVVWADGTQDSAGQATLPGEGE
jgi:hypothetical protein